MVNHLDYIRIYPDTKSTLKQLASYKKAIITNTPTDCARQILRKFEIEQYFEAIITSDDVVKAKPDPEIVFKACERLGVDSKNSRLSWRYRERCQSRKSSGMHSRWSEHRCGYHDSEIIRIN